MKVNHIVLLKFKENITLEQITECFQKLENLQNVIPGILSFSWGPYESSEGLNQGFKYGFKMVFDSILSRDNYLKDEKHSEIAKTIVEKLQSFPEGVISFDFANVSPPSTPRTICEGINEIIAEDEITIELLNDARTRLQILQKEIDKEPKKYERKFSLGSTQKTFSTEKISKQINNLLDTIDSKLESKVTFSSNQL